MSTIVLIYSSFKLRTGLCLYPVVRTEGINNNNWEAAAKTLPIAITKMWVLVLMNKDAIIRRLKGKLTKAGIM